METYSNLLNAPCKVINLKKNSARWNITQERLNTVGFTNIERFDAISPDTIKENWDKVGNPKIAVEKDECFANVLGKQGCFLSHILIWKDIIETKRPFTVIFEDDILFHELWDTIAPLYFEKTPKDYDIMYLGSQFQKASCYHIDKVPVYCLHAYVITFEGATKLYNMIMSSSIGVYTIDCMLLDFMYADLYKWYVWNGYAFYPSNLKMSHKWAIRNNGLVYQDEVFGTDIM